MLAQKELKVWPLNNNMFQMLAAYFYFKNFNDIRRKNPPAATPTIKLINILTHLSGGLKTGFMTPKVSQANAKLL